MAAHKLALVLSGGGMGGAAHIGAIKALEEYNLIPDAVLGTSIGAFVGSVYASGATAQMLIDGWRAISGRKLSSLLDLDLGSIRQAVYQLDHTHVTGFLIGQALMDVQTDNYVHITTFQQLARLSPTERKARNIKEFYASATSLMDGIETIFCDTSTLDIGHRLDEHGLYCGRRLVNHVSFVDAVRASFSLPAVFKPYRIDCPQEHPHHYGHNGSAYDCPGYHLYVDGAIKDDYPITIAAKVAQADKIIGINLTRAGAKVNLSLNGGLPDIQSRILKIVAEDQYEADRADRDVAQVDLITIDPAIGDVAVFDMSMGDWLIERGYQSVKQCFQEKGLHPNLSPEENLSRLFPPHWVESCPECAQILPQPRDLASDELFVAQFPPENEISTAVAPRKKGGLSVMLKEAKLWLILGGILLLFLLGGFQFWWVYRLAGGTGSANMIMLGGGLVYAATVLIAALLIGSWLTLFLRNLLRRFQVEL